jgi:hypothetical protein
MIVGMKKILVIYYSQTGQILRILQNLVKPLEKDNHVHFFEIKSESSYPFPWGKEFLNCFPETVKGIPCKLVTKEITEKNSYDLIILGYQPWYLSPSIPVSSFLKSEEAKEIFHNKKVITVIGSRNMWVSAQEIVKQHLITIKAHLVGNIALVDKTNSYISVITFIGWLVYGIKRLIILPEAGVSEKDILKTIKFGELINESFQNNSWDSLQMRLMSAKAISIKYHLLSIEINARKIFDKFADYILRKGNVGDIKRNPRIELFKYYLLFAIFIAFPIVSLLYIIIRIILFPYANKKISYYKRVELEP